MTLKIKRLVASVSASIEDVVGKLENHEAVADCLLDDLRKGISRVKVQRSRIDAQAQRTEKQRQQAQEDVQRWQQRALQVADDDESKALHCLQRGEHSAALATTLTEQLNAHLTTLQQLDARIAEMETNLNELVLKRASLSARQINARTKNPGSGDCAQSATQLFDRWEESVITHESAAGLDGLGSEVASDTIEREFLEQEQQDALKEKLAALRATARSESDSAKGDQS